MTSTIPYPRVASRDEWLAARKALLAEEKAFTHARDALNARRRELPAVALDKDYTFDTGRGAASLAELFEGRSQLVVYHFMFLRDQHQGCPGCSFMADNVPHLAHFHARDTTFALVSRAPLGQEVNRKYAEFRSKDVSDWRGAPALLEIRFSAPGSIESRLGGVEPRPNDVNSRALRWVYREARPRRDIYVQMPPGYSRTARR
jgi:hypothetical protein